MARKSAAQSTEPTIQFQNITETVRIRRVTIPPGGVVQPYSVNTGYVVFPLSKEIATVRRTTFLNGKVAKVEELKLDPDQPFYVAGFKPGMTVSIENLGGEPIIMGKRPTKPPPKKGWPPSKSLSSYKKAGAKKAR